MSPTASMAVTVGADSGEKKAKRKENGLSEKITGSGPAEPMTSAGRLPPIAPETYDMAQRKAAEDFMQVRHVPVFGPFEVLMRSPELMMTAQAMGDYLRYRSAIGTRLSELVILMVARRWSQDFEWNSHAPIAARQGIAADLIEAIADGRRPPAMSDDETTVYDMVDELDRNQRLSDATYDRAVRRFGERGVVDIAGLVGYYGLLAVTMNIARMPVPADGRKLPRFPD